MENWINIEEKLPPHGKNVIGVFNRKHFAIVFHLEAMKEIAEGDFDDFSHFTDYNQETEIGYWKEGWYEELEQFQHEYDYVWTPRKITHWMPLPELPTI